MKCKVETTEIKFEFAICTFLRLSKFQGIGKKNFQVCIQIKFLYKRRTNILLLNQSNINLITFTTITALIIPALILELSPDLMYARLELPHG